MSLIHPTPLLFVFFPIKFSIFPAAVLRRQLRYPYEAPTRVVSGTTLPLGRVVWATAYEEAATGYCTAVTALLDPATHGSSRTGSSSG